MLLRMAVTGLLLSASSLVQAQEVQSLSRSQRNLLGASEGEVECDPFYFGDASAEVTEAQYAAIAACAEQLQQVVATLSAEQPSQKVNQELVGARTSFKRLKKWGDYRRVASTAASKIMAKRALGIVDTTLEDALRTHGLFAQFSASLVTGPSFSDTQKDDKGDEKTKSLALGNVVWETRHFGDVSLQPVDVSIGGRLGMQPVLTMVTASGDGALPVVTGTHQTAFAWSLDVDLHKQHNGINAETGLFVRTGAAQLTTVPSLVDRGTGSFVVLPVDNGVGKTAWLWETGLEFTMYDTRLAQVHSEKGTTTPQFQLGVAWRHDSRFKRSGAMAGYDKPEQRLVFRMTIDAIQVLDRRAFGQPAKPFTFGFSVEHERGFSRNGPSVPSATRYLLRGDLNLLKGLTSTDLPKPATP